MSQVSTDPAQTAVDMFNGPPMKQMRYSPLSQVTGTSSHPSDHSNQDTPGTSQRTLGLRPPFPSIVARRVTRRSSRLAQQNRTSNNRDVTQGTSHHTTPPTFRRPQDISHHATSPTFRRPIEVIDLVTPPNIRVSPSVPVHSDVSSRSRFDHTLTRNSRPGFETFGAQQDEVPQFFSNFTARSSYLYGEDPMPSNSVPATTQYGQVAPTLSNGYDSTSPTNSTRVFPATSHAGLDSSYASFRYQSVPQYTGSSAIDLFSQSTTPDYLNGSDRNLGDEQATRTNTRAQSQQDTDCLWQRPGQVPHHQGRLQAQYFPPSTSLEHASRQSTFGQESSRQQSPHHNFLLPLSENGSPIQSTPPSSFRVPSHLQYMISPFALNSFTSTPERVVPSATRGTTPTRNDYWPLHSNMYPSATLDSPPPYPGPSPAALGVSLRPRPQPQSPQPTSSQESASSSEMFSHLNQLLSPPALGPIMSTHESPSIPADHSITEPLASNARRPPRQTRPPPLEIHIPRGTVLRSRDSSSPGSGPTVERPGQTRGFNRTNPTSRRSGSSRSSEVELIIVDDSDSDDDVVIESWVRGPSRPSQSTASSAQSQLDSDAAFARELQAQFDQEYNTALFRAQDLAFQRPASADEVPVVAAGPSVPRPRPERNNQDDDDVRDGPARSRDNYDALASREYRWTPRDASTILRAASRQHHFHSRGRTNPVRSRRHAIADPSRYLIHAIMGSRAGGSTYEDLLELAETLGPARPQGVSQSTINMLPSRTIESHEESEDKKCVVCMCEYQEREKVRCLPCVHEFHQGCIDEWLKEHLTCPICRVEVRIH